MKSSKASDIHSMRHIHIVGPGGVGISALARLLVVQGKKITGTEDNESRETLNELRAQGVQVSLDLNPSKIPAADCYLYSDAWDTKHPEVVAEMKSRGAPVWTYFQALGQIANQSKCLIAVSGTHGKTTTTAMITDVLEAAGLDPVAIIGSLRAKTKSNFRAGKDDYFVAEADEYKRHFLSLSPKILVITNIDNDHLDYYKDLGDIQGAFRELAQKVPDDGIVVCDRENENLKPVIQGFACTVVDYKKYFDPELPMKVLPLHRINAAAALAVADILKIATGAARRALADYAGTWRRFEYKGKTPKGALVYDDYGHHPTEVGVTLRSVRGQFPDKKIVVVFHPHLYSRTKILMDEFAKAFGDADEIILAPIFAAREQPDPSVSSDILAEKIRVNGKNVRALPSFKEIGRYLLKNTGEGDLILTMGAGDIYKVGEHITKK